MAVEVERLAAPPSPRTFAAEYVARNRPVVITGAIDDWPARARWTRSLLDAHAHVVVPLAPLPCSGPGAFCDKALEDAALWTGTIRDPEPEPEPEGVVRDDVVLAVAAERELRPLGDLLEATARLRGHVLPAIQPSGDGGEEASRAKAHPPPVTYYADGAGNFDKAFAFLRDDVRPPPCASLLKLRRADLWLGGRSVSTAHYDNLDNLFAQVIGTKRFVLFPPSAARLATPGRLRKAYRRRACAAQTAGDNASCAQEEGEIVDCGARAHFSRAAGRLSSETVLNYWPERIEVVDCATSPSQGTSPDACGPPLVGSERCVVRSAESGAEVEAAVVDVRPGDLLYLPFGWWHQVEGLPDPASGLCASVSHFYTPFFCRLGGRGCRQIGDLMVHPRYAVLARACSQGLLGPGRGHCAGSDDEREEEDDGGEEEGGG